MRIRPALAALALPVALLAGCGDGDGDDAGEATDPATSATPSGSASESPSGEATASADPSADPSVDWPACDEVWRDGARLPRGYQGCLEADTVVKADGRACSFGRPLITYADHFYGVPSGVIHETAGPLEKDRDYRGDLASCTA